jgi:LacI family transcriptional regulator
MKDIARDLGVSIMTVSKAIRNHSDIGEETRRRVMQRIEELNYTPNASARSLVTGRSNVVALVAPDLVHPFFAELARGLTAVLRPRGYSLVISSSEGDAALERQEIEQLLSRGVDALIVATVQTKLDSFEHMQEHGTPFLLIDRHLKGLKANFIGVDDELMGRLATEHLIAAGCKRIAHIAGGVGSTASGRLEGFRQTVLERGLRESAELVYLGTHSDDLGDRVGYSGMRQLLERRPRPDGVFCYNDPVAMGALQSILEAGLRVPEDIKVIGCGDLHYAKYLRVPLSSVAQQSEAMGEKAALMVLDLIAAKGTGRVKTVLLEPRVVVRESTRPS